MRSLISMLLVFSFTLCTAQDLTGEFIRKKLSVEVEKKIIASLSDWDAYINSNIRVGGAYLEIRESKKWKSYIGGFEASEADFFRTAGYSEHANAAYSYHSTTNMLNWGGAALAFGGIAMMLIALGSKSEYEDNPGAVGYIGAGVWLVGISMGLAGMSRHQKFPASFAVEVADDHNRRLLKDLEKQDEK